MSTQINATYIHNSCTSLVPALHPVDAPTMTHGHKGSVEQISGFIFLCNGETKPECYRYRVFALPLAKLDVVEKIEPGTKLFLFDFGMKRLYGIYAAASRGGMNLEPAAFNGKFPAQVKFTIVSDCLPLAESAFKHAIKDNYEGSKFKQELSSEQVKNLLSLFQPFELPLSVSKVPTVANVAAAHTLQAARPSLNLPGPDLANPLSVLNARLNERYAFRKHGQHIQPSTMPQYVVQQATLPRHIDPLYSAEAPRGYLPENTYDPQRSYEVALEMHQRNRTLGYENQYHMAQLQQQGSDTSLSSDSMAMTSYYGQYLPSATSSQVSLHGRPLAPSYTLPTTTSTKEQLQLTYQSYYAQPTHENQSQVYINPLQKSMLGSSAAVEAHLPVSSRYYFAGAASTYQQ